MKRYYIVIVKTVCFMLAMVGTMQVSAQVHDTTTTHKERHTKIYDNKLDVIYDENDGEYSGIKVERKPVSDDEKTSIYRPMVILPPPDMEDESVDLEPMVYQGVEDEGVEDEADILWASGDTTLVHIKRMDLNLFHDTTIALVDPSKGHLFVFPTPDKAIPTSHFGPRRRRWHYGLDMGLATGEPIYAAFDGVVRFSNFNSSYGNLIVVRHYNGLETYYAHLSKRNVHAGDVVKAGQVIGLCGNTGRSYGSHLHFEIRYNGVAMNPEHVVDASTRKLRADQLTMTRSTFAKVANGHKSSTTANSNTATKSGNQYYRVRQGDTLSKIAKRNGTTVKRLCQLNGIKETSILSIGQRLRVR